MPKSPHIKICCIASQAEAEMALEAGASAIGLVGPMPSGPGPIPNALIADIARAMRDRIDTWLLTSETEAEAIIAHHRLTRTHTIQLVDAISEKSYDRLRAVLPDIKLVQVIHVLDETALEEARTMAAHADILLLDSGNPTLKIKQLGGTGRTHNWEISRAIVASVTVPVFLAGGLRPENVAQALQSVQPYGLDLCSGVRTNGALNVHQLRAFIENAQKAGQ